MHEIGIGFEIGNHNVEDVIGIAGDRKGRADLFVQRHETGEIAFLALTVA